ncbi:MAG: c-type cytochrome [Alphaproteobacteria bacterium]|nr:c-type cytochrome [Alphaproteobacteria bacterium]
MTTTRLIAAGAALIAGLTFAGADARANEDGAKVFRTKCATCHTIEKGKHKVGPALDGIVGKQAGTAEGFTRYVGLKGASFKWTKDDLNKYITDPEAFIKAKGGARSSMAFKLPNEKERHNVIEYLEKAK